MKKFLSLVLCAAIASCTFCACEKGNSSGEDVAMEDLEYGATLRKLGNTEIDICFDGRFFTDEEMRVVADYYYAVQTQDKELFTSTQSAPYIAYIEKNSGKTVDDFLTEIHDKTAASLSNNFEYTYIEAVACGDKTDDLQIDEISALMDAIYEENGNDTCFSETVTSSKYAVLDMIANANGESFTFSDQTVYIFTCTDGIYVFI